MAHPTTVGQSVVREALAQEEAVFVIQRAWRRLKRSTTRPRKRRRRAPPPRMATTTTSSSNSRGEHWLWKSLRSQSIAERMAAVRLLLLTKSEAHRWMPPLIRLLQQHVVTTTITYEPNVGPKSSLALEWVALLQDYCLLEEGGGDAAYRFRPYWNWLTQAVWTLATTEESSSNNNYRNRKNSTALCALIHLVHSLALAAPSEAHLPVVQRFHSSCLWTTATTTTTCNIAADSLSPLACLIGAYYSQWSPHPARDMLRQLVHCSTLPHVAVVVPANNKTSSNSNHTTTTTTTHKAPVVNKPVVEAAPPPRAASSLLVEGYDSDFGREEEEQEDTSGTVDVTTETAKSRSDSTNNNATTEQATDSVAQQEQQQPQQQEEEDHESEEEEDEIMQEADEDDDDDEDEDEDEEEDSDDDEGDEPADCVADICMDEDETNDLTGAIERSLGLGGGGDAEEEAAKSDNNNKSSNKRVSSPAVLQERHRLYVAACMQVLGAHYPHTHNHVGPTRRPLLTVAGENALIKSINKIIKPPKKPLNTKIILRRAPTQEEFFRGSLSRNPVAIASLKPAATQKDSYEPTVADLRQHIANDLQMADSAELIEILVANKILDVRLKLRVVHQVLWRQHVMEHPNSGLSSYFPSGTVVSRGGSGFSILFSSESRGEEKDEEGLARRITENTPTSALPSMLATYRLAGVDGEATEMTVDLEDLADPEAPVETTSTEEIEKRLEEEYGITSLVATEGRGVYVLLRSVQHCVMDVVSRVRRDDVGCVGENPSRKLFKQSPPCHALSLLRYCTRLACNRKRLLQARAPTVLLTLLLDVLKALEVTSGNQTSGGNPTSEVLQELIESLTSDIASTAESVESGYESDMAQDAASMPLLLEHIETISLSPPLHSIIAKLLPFLTYGQVDLSRELAQHFDRHISLDSLAASETPEDSSHLMQTFVDTAISLPATTICNTLRAELIKCGFVDRLALFVMKDMPKQPPTWSPALWAEGELPDATPKKVDIKKKNEDGWRSYYNRQGVGTAFKILTGLCKKHAPMQSRIAMFSGFVECCHWIEATSDNTAAGISTNGLGLLAETLLDEAVDDNKTVGRLVEDIRRKTKLTKRSLAQHRRKQALLKMHSLGAPGMPCDESNRHQSTVRGAAASIFAPVLGLFRDANPTDAATSASGPGSGSKLRSSKRKKEQEQKKPAWLAEAESMVEETGLKCAVCQEGRTLQPEEMLGLYSFVKKVSMPTSNTHCSRSAIDGTDLLMALPSTMPASLVGDPIAEDWYARGLQAKSAVEDREGSSHSSSRRNVYTTTTSAGNAIHMSCHRRARLADRNHPKAPKSEWEGASLRNNRVECNAILPLLSSQSSSVPLVHLNAGLSDYQSVVANIVDSSPSCMLWPVLHDIRFLLLRMAYGESLSADCGGGSLTSNCQLLLYQLRLAELFDKEAQLDHRDQSHHVRGLSSGCLLACSLLFRKDAAKKPCTEMARGVADASPMAALTSIVFHNTLPCGSGSSSSNDSAKPNPKREWLVGRELYLRALLMCAGRRHVLNLNSSGCQSNRSLSGRKRSFSFADWDEQREEGQDEDGAARSKRDKPARRRPNRGRSTSPTVEDFQNAFRPMITLFAILDKLSAEFSASLDDVQIEESGQRLAGVIESCQRSRSIHELIGKANVPLDHAQMMDLLQMGMVLG